MKTTIGYDLSFDISGSLEDTNLRPFGYNQEPGRRKNLSTDKPEND